MKPSHLSSTLTSKHEASLPMSYLKCWGGDFFMFSQTMIVSRQAYWLPTVVITQNSFYKAFGSFDGVYVSIPGSMSLVVASQELRENTLGLEATGQNATQENPALSPSTAAFLLWVTSSCGYWERGNDWGKVCKMLDDLGGPQIAFCLVRLLVCS